MKYEGEKNNKHGEKESLGVLITNLGTPDKPQRKELKIYLLLYMIHYKAILLYAI